MAGVRSFLQVKGCILTAASRNGFRAGAAAAAGRSNVLLTTTTRNLSQQSSQPPLVSVDKDPTNDRIRVLTLNRPPVNSLNLDLLQQLIQAIDQLEKEAGETELDGVIITSSSKSVFSAGLDLKEMLNPDQKRLTEYWGNLQEFWIRLYGCQLTVVSAISGHAPAAGTLIACCSDYRVMTDNPKLTIGLNETKFGLAAPTWLAGCFVSTVGQRQGEKALALGTLFSPGQALEIGLVDELGSDAEDTMAKSRSKLAEFGRNRMKARALTKTLVRQPFIDNLRNKFDADVKFYVDLISSEYFQTCVGNYLKSLSSKK